ASSRPRTGTNHRRRPPPQRTQGFSTSEAAGASSPRFESKRESFRELGLHDRSLSAFDVVTDAPELECLAVHVPDAIACQRAAVSWLSDAAGGDQRRPLQLERFDAILVRHLTADQAKDPGHASMS